MAKKLKETDLIKIVDNHLSKSETYNTKMAQERAIAIKYFNQDNLTAKKPKDNVQRSTLTSSEVMEVHSWALAQLMNAVYQQDVCEFDPAGPTYEDQINAELATEYAHYVFYKKNNAQVILETAAHDGLLQKNGVGKVFYDNTPEYCREEYQGITENEFLQLVSQKDVTPIEKDEIEAYDSQTEQFIKFYDVVVKRKKTKSANIKIENIPSEEIIVSSAARSIDLDQAPFVAHKVKRTISWLRQQGYTVKDDIQDGTALDTEYSAERVAREMESGHYNDTDNTTIDPTQREVWVVEAYFKCDFDGDGIAELRKVTKVGDVVLDNEEVYTQPFISWSPFPQPHQYDGKSMADFVLDLQRWKTNLIRLINDTYAMNMAPRTAVNISALVSLDDLLDTNPGSVIRMKQDVNNAFSVSQVQPLGQEAFSLLGYIDNNLESRTGVNRMTQGVDANVFNKTATGTQAIMDASQAKISLIIRHFGEQFIAAAYKKIIKLASRYAKGEELISINNKFIQVNPKRWTDIDSINVKVGTGSMEKQADLMNINALMGFQNQLLQAPDPTLKALVSVENVHNLITKAVKTMGYDSNTSFFTNPREQQYGIAVQEWKQKMQPAPDPNMALVDVEHQKMEQKMLIDTAEFELKKQEADRKFELEKAELAAKYSIEAAKLEQKDQHLVMNMINQIPNINPSSQLLPASEMAAIQSVAKIQEDNQPQQMPQAPQPEPQMQAPTQQVPQPTQMHHEIIRDDNGKMISVKSTQIMPEPVVPQELNKLATAQPDGI